MDFCILCKSCKKDDVQYGEFLKNKHFGVHTYCLYLSSNLLQRGQDDEGFLGFLNVDIRKEVRRIASLSCCYCHKNYANIGCCEKRCRRSFHFICGLERGAENQFCHNFRSFCDIHVKKWNALPSLYETCLICYESVRTPGRGFKRVNVILTPCCRNGWFHKLCLQKFAKTAGYFFKCPLCNDDKIFREKLPTRGIFIPNRDAAWELEPNAFNELLERPNECSAPQCTNKNGRKGSTNTNPLVMCRTCGSKAIHQKCLANDKRLFHCVDCIQALEHNDSDRESLNSGTNYGDDEYIDICNVSDKENFDIIARFIGSNDQNVENQRVYDTHINHDLPHSSKSHLRHDEECSADTLMDEKIVSGCNVNTNSLKSIANFEDTPGEEDVIKPVGRRQKRHFRIDSESAVTSHISKRVLSHDTESRRDTSNTKSITPKQNIKEFNSNSSSTEDSEDYVKPVTRMQTRRLRIDSETLELPHSSKTVLRPCTESSRDTMNDDPNPYVRNVNTKEMIPKQNIDESISISDSSEEDYIKPNTRMRKQRLRIDSENSELSQSLKTVLSSYSESSRDSLKDDQNVCGMNNYISRLRHIVYNAQSTSNSYSSSEDNVHKSNSAIRKLRLQSDSDSSELPHTSKSVLRCNTEIIKDNINTKRTPRSGECGRKRVNPKMNREESFSNSESSGAEDIIKPVAANSKRYFRSDSESSNVSRNDAPSRTDALNFFRENNKSPKVFKFRKGKSPNIFNSDSGDELIENAKLVAENSEESEIDEPYASEYVGNPYKKRKCLEIVNGCETNLLTEESLVCQSPNDPSENVTIFTNKKEQATASMTAEINKLIKTQGFRKEEKVNLSAKDIYKKNTKIKSPQIFPKIGNDLDTSCIAKRTRRRRTYSSKSKNMQMECKDANVSYLKAINLIECGSNTSNPSEACDINESTRRCIHRISLYISVESEAARLIRNWC